MPAETATEPIPVRDLLGQRVREIRQANGWTQRYLAEELAEHDLEPKNASGVNRIEKGGRDVTVAELVGLAYALGVTPTALLTSRYDSRERIWLGGDSIDMTTWRAWITGRTLLPLQQAAATWPLDAGSVSSEDLVEEFGAGEARGVVSVGGLIADPAEQDLHVEYEPPTVAPFVPPRGKGTHRG